MPAPSTKTSTGQVRLACVAAPVPDFGAASLYELSLRARRVTSRDPKFCLYGRGPDRCRPLPAVGIWDGWTPYEALLTPDPDAVETRLYLYGRRDLKEEQQSRVEYRQVRLRPVASPTTVVLVREGVPAPAAPVDWRRVNPARYTADVTSDGPVVLGLAEGAAPGWTVQGAAARGATQVTLQGWMNGWRLPAGGPVTVAYAPARYARAALFLAPVGVAAAAGWMLAGRLGFGGMVLPKLAVGWARAGRRRWRDRGRRRWRTRVQRWLARDGRGRR